MKFKDYVKRGLGIAIGATFGFIVTGAAMETATILLRKMQPKEDNESTDEDIREEE